MSVSRKNTYPMEPRFIILRRDITGRKKVEEDLRTHQIELQMQNEELLRKQEELDALRLKYFDLYDLSPESSFTLNEEGLILEANLSAASMFNVERNSLINQAFTKFIVKEDQDIFYLYSKEISNIDPALSQAPNSADNRDSGESALCKLRMQRIDGSVFNAYLKGVASPNNENLFIFRFAVLMNSLV